MKYLLMLVLLFSFSQASATFLTGNELLPTCEEFIAKTTDQYFKAATCQAYIMGVADARSVSAGWKEIEKDICLPDNADSRQLVRVVIKYLQEHPEELHFTASALVVNALILAFTCE